MLTRHAVPAFAALLVLCSATPTYSAAPAADPAASLPKAAQSFAVNVVGRGKPMLLIPGLTCGGDVWNGTVEHFKDRYQCHVLTLAGFAGQPAIGGAHDGDDSQRHRVVHSREEAHPPSYRRP